jgi:GNAT superfamily N-acetyltransferase
MSSFADPNFSPDSDSILQQLGLHSETGPRTASEKRGTGTNSRRRSLRFRAGDDSAGSGDQQNENAIQRTFSWPRVRDPDAEEMTRMEALCGDGYEFFGEILPRGVRFVVKKDGEVLVPSTFGLSLSHLPGGFENKEPTIDKFNIALKHRRQGHGTEIMRRLAKWYRAGGSSAFQVTAWTETGRRFYRKCGFEHSRDGLRNLVFRLEDAEQLIVRGTRASPRPTAFSTPLGTTPATTVGTTGSVYFKMCLEQIGNSCGPHAARNALLALNNEYAVRIDVTMIDVHADWIDSQLAAASRPMTDPCGLVPAHVLHVGMLQMLTPGNKDSWQFAVDPIICMMSSIILDARDRPRKILVITPTQDSAANWRALSHFICVEISWDTGVRPRLDLGIMESSSPQKELHGQRVKTSMEKLRGLLLPAFEDLCRCMTPHSVTSDQLLTATPGAPGAAGPDHGQKSKEVETRHPDSQSTTAERGSALSPSHVGKDGGGALAPAELSSIAQTSSASALAGPAASESFAEHESLDDFTMPFSPIAFDDVDVDSTEDMSVCSQARTVVAVSDLAESEGELSDSSILQQLARAPARAPFVSPPPTVPVPANRKRFRGGYVTMAERQPKRRRKPIAASCLSDHETDDEAPGRALSPMVLLDNGDQPDAEYGSDREFPGVPSFSDLSDSSTTESDGQDLERSSTQLRDDIDVAISTTKKKRSAAASGNSSAMGRRQVDRRLDGRRAGNTALRKCIRELDAKCPDWTILPVAGKSNFVSMQEKATKNSFSVPINRVAKAVTKLNHASCMEAMVPKACGCGKRCYEQLKSTEVLAMRKENYEKNDNETDVTNWLATRLRGDGNGSDGCPFTLYGRGVCATFYAKVFGVGRKKALKARKLAIAGRQAIQRGSTEFRAPTANPVPLKHDISAAFWEEFIEIFSQRPNDYCRLYPADMTKAQIFETCFAPWFKRNVTAGNYTWKFEPGFSTFKTAFKNNPRFRDVKRKAKHRHCRCVVCADLKTERIGAFQGGADVEDWKQRKAMHEEEVRAWRTFEEYMKSIGVSAPEENVVLGYDDTSLLGNPRTTNRPLKNFGCERHEVVPFCIKDYGTKRREDYIYSAKWTSGKDVNRLISMLHMCLRRIKADYDHPNHKARTLYLIADSASENKNNELFAYCHLLVDAKWFDDVYLVFGPVGHTHNGVDAVHHIHNNQVGQYFSGDLGHYVYNYAKAFRRSPDASYLEEILDWKTYLAPSLRAPDKSEWGGASGLESYGRLAGWRKSKLNPRAVRGFKVSRGLDGNIDLKWKVDPAIEKEWRGRDGSSGPEARGFYLMKYTPEGCLFHHLYCFLLRARARAHVRARARAHVRARARAHVRARARARAHAHAHAYRAASVHEEDGTDGRQGKAARENGRKEMERSDGQAESGHECKRRLEH